MRNYLSFGGGVNSVALYLYLIEQGINFEAIFVDHSTDWPENYQFVYNFAEKYPLTILYPDVEATEKIEGFHSLYEYCYYKKIIPSMMLRWCTDKFKVQIVNRYIEKPCFMNIGFDAGETRRAKINYNNGIENRFPLIEANINRDGCKKIIRSHGLAVPQKSGCYICPFQKRTQWIELRKRHPDLFCAAEQLENQCIENRTSRGKSPIYLAGSYNAMLKSVIDENQRRIFKQDEYPPCECML
jgi:3'-phosphoadenosine 5'-phosphosulfate sulfotransferase (PAPS reductase)/FAD synthetase